MADVVGGEDQRPDLGVPAGDSRSTGRLPLHRPEGIGPPEVKPQLMLQQ